MRLYRVGYRLGVAEIFRYRLDYHLHVDRLSREQVQEHRKLLYYSLKLSDVFLKVLREKVYYVCRNVYVVLVYLVAEYRHAQLVVRRLYVCEKSLLKGGAVLSSCDSSSFSAGGLR